MEIPDVIAINRRNHPAAKTLLQELRSTLVLEKDAGWTIPIVLTEAVEEEGIEDLWAAVEAHRAFLEASGELDRARRRRLGAEVFALASARAKTHLERAVADDPELVRLLADVEERRLDPLSAVQEVLERVFRIGGRNGQA
jgi:LAO/AO transport system kinase